MGLVLLLSLPFLLPSTPTFAAPATSSGRAFDPDRALSLSQAAVGRPLAPVTLVDRKEQVVRLADFKGRPLIISMVYTSCYQICSISTRALFEVVKKGWDALGEESFNVVTVGFDTHFDKPATMAWFAKQQGVDDLRWRFLSGDAAEVKRLADNLGFSYVRSPKGFDHLIQATVVDGEGIIRAQIYGETFPAPLLVDPLKNLILGTPPSEESLAQNLVRRVRFFCTTYDPTRDAYRFDYSLFVGMFIGGTIILVTAFWLVGEIRRAKRLGGS